MVNSGWDSEHWTLTVQMENNSKMDKGLIYAFFELNEIWTLIKIQTGIHLNK